MAEAEIRELPIPYRDKQVEVVSFSLDLSKLYIPPRARKKHERVKELAESFAKFGQAHPIIVRPLNPDEKKDHPDKEWALVAGGRRTAAAVLLGWKSIRAENRDDLPIWMQLALELEENLQRENMDPFDVAEGRARLHDLYVQNNPGWQQQDTAKLLGQSNATITQDLKLAKAVKEDPTLKKAGSKKRALRHHDTRQQFRVRESKMLNLDKAGLRSKMVTADMRDYAKTIESRSVDLLFCDLPYGIDYDSLPDKGMDGKGISEYDDSKESVRDLLVDAVPHFVRICKPTAWMVLFMNRENYNYLEDLIKTCCVVHGEYLDLEEMNGRCKVHNNQVAEAKAKKDKNAIIDKCRFVKPADLPWIWYRPNSRNNSIYPDRIAKNMYETIMVVNMGQAKFTQEGYTNVLVYDAEYGDERIHSMQKPLAICEEVIRRTTITNEMVVDLCFGSGNSLAAAAKLGRNFRGCEKNPELLDFALNKVAPFYSSENVVQKAPQPSAALKQYKTCENCGSKFSGESCMLCSDDEEEDGLTLEERMTEEEDDEDEPVPF